MTSDPTSDRPSGTAARTVDAVLFDLGRVLVRWDPFLPFEGHRSRPEVEAFFEAIDFPAFNHLQDAGRPLAEAAAVLDTTHPEHAPMFRHYVEHFARSVPGEVPGARELVADVRAAGLRVLGLTNWSAENVHVAYERAPVVHELEDVLVSGAVGVAKPDPRVFRIAAERFDLDPARTLFTDDMPRNVDAARTCGFHAVRYDGPADVRRWLRAHGVDVPAA